MLLVCVLSALYLAQGLMDQHVFRNSDCASNYRLPSYQQDTGVQVGTYCLNSRGTWIEAP